MKLSSSIKNISDIKTSTSKPRLIHFTTEQWNKAVAKIPVEDFNQKRHGKLKGIIAIQNPDEVILYPQCMPDPSQECIMKQVLGPGGMLSFKCFCRPAKTSGPGGSGGSGGSFAEMPGCTFIYQPNPNFQGGFFACVGSCPGGRCRIRRIRIHLGHITLVMIVCRCVRN